MRRLRAIPFALLLGLLVLAGRRAGADDDRTLSFLSFDHYYDVEQLGTALARVHAAFPERTRLASMGTSREGRPLWVLTAFDPDTGDPDEKPAFYADGNTHGNEVQGAEICLYTIKSLLTKDDPWVRDLLRHVTFHIAPCVNPDARQRYFHGTANENGPRGVFRPVDDDRDGLFDEDGPDDIDGDGQILMMRVKDPNGAFVVDERDDRLMRRRRPGEAGQYRLLGLEGTDEDGDGRLNEDGPGAVDPNRNWPAAWRPERYQYGAGPYPLSEPETRATALWILGHPRIAGVQSFHNAGRMILRPPAAFTDREIGMPGEDRRLYEEIGRRGLQVLPTYRLLQIREQLYRVFGGFVDWTYFDLGIFSFTNEVWGRVAQGVPNAPDDPELAELQWNDVALHGEGFVRWHEVPHPQYGTVELGGWKRFTMRTNPPDFLAESCVRNSLFVLEHASMLPRLSVKVLERLPDGSLRAEIRNEGATPTIHALARRTHVLPPDRVRVRGGRLLAAARERPGRSPEALDVVRGEARLPDGIDGNERVVLRLYTDGDAEGVEVESRLGGVARSAGR